MTESEEEEEVIIEVVDESVAWREFVYKKCNAEMSRLRLHYRTDNFFAIDYWEVVRWSDSMAERIHSEPEQVLRILPGVVADVYLAKVGKPLPERPEIQIVGLGEREVNVRDLRSDLIGKMISLRGIIRSASDVRPEVTTATFRCLGCAYLERVQQGMTQLRYPQACPRNCGSRKWELLPQLSVYRDSQRVAIQEEPEGLDGGEQPKSIVCKLYGSLAGKINPGTRCAINGILRAEQNRKDTVFDINLVSYGIEFNANELLGLVISEDDETAIRGIADDPNVLSRLLASTAPGIYGYEEIKLAILLQLVGGVSKNNSDGTRVRGDIHILLIGDPGVAKSQMMRSAAKISPRGVITSGKSSTTAGLTATAVKDETGDGRWVLEAGALVLADGGFLGVDELDKMSKEDRSSLHEAMEQQTLSISKAGISAVLHTRCALLGAANPKLGRFTQYEPILSQIDMPPSLLSRFDLIFPMIDKPDKNRDTDIANHILKKYQGDGATDPVSVIDQGLLRKYITYAREHIHPKIPAELNKKIQEYYTGNRMKSVGENITITARQLEAIIRLSQASARLRLSLMVEEEDVDRAIYLIEYYMRQVAFDENTQTYDTDMIATKMSSKQRSKVRMVTDVIQTLSDEYGSARYQLVVETLVGQGMKPDEVDTTVEKLKQERIVYEPSNGKLKLV